MKHDFQPDIEKLGQGILPENWEWVESSKLAKVAKYSGETTSYYKEFIPKNRLEVVKSRVRGSKCELWIKHAEIGRKAGFAVPEVLSTGILKNRNPYLVTASGPSTSVSDYLARKTDNNEKDRRQWIKAFGQFVGEMHKAGIVHGDLRAGNILMSVDNGKPEFVMIDIERNSYHSVVPIRLVKKNLVQLIKRIAFREFTAKDRLTFFNAYNNSYNRFSCEEQKKLALDVINLVKKQGLWGG